MKTSTSGRILRCLAGVVAIMIGAPLSSVAEHDLLAGYDTGGLAFRELEIGTRLVVYYHQRMLGEATVEKDFIVYQFDRGTGELLDRKEHWREDLPVECPGPLMDQADAEALAYGEIKSARLLIIAPDSDVYPLDPAPRNPCWVVRGEMDGQIHPQVFDAVTGEFLGLGVPPPYTAFSLTGPIYFYPCHDSWETWSSNARYWFNGMGYATEHIIWPQQSQVQGHIQSDDTALFYELAHGGSNYFQSGCNDGQSPEYTHAGEIAVWIYDYEKMPFTFLGSCDGMCDTGNGSLSHEFRKGSNVAAVTVGYCGMSTTACEDCWGNSIGWQSALFSYASMGWTLKDAFDQANADYPMCAAALCMRFAGDESMTLVPVVSRLPYRYACCIGDDCQILNVDECSATGGEWLEGIETCDPNPCPGREYACCIEETCQITTWSDCMAQEGNWRIGVTACDPNPCFYQFACCFEEECQVLTLAECTAAGGEWRAGIESCDPNPCLYEFACCVGDTCTVMTNNACSAANGEWLSGTESCDPNPCPDREYACCLGGLCFIAPWAECTAAGGDWLVGVATCEGGPCIDLADLAGGHLIAHYVPEMVWTSDPPLEGWCGVYADSFALGPGGTQNVRIDHAPDEMSLWFVIAAWDSPKEFCGVQFGFGDYESGAYGIYDFGVCFTDTGLEIPSAGWPGPNEGIAFVTSGTSWTGNYVPVYFIAGYAYPSATVIPLGVDPSVVEPFGGFTNCAASPEKWAAACFGAMGINSAGQTCYPPTADRVCCVEAECFLLTQPDCELLGGAWHPEWTTCDPNPCGTTGIGERISPAATYLYAPVPNPTSGATELRFRLVQGGALDVAIYDAAGRLVRRLFAGTHRAGEATLTWDGRTARGLRAGPGAYFCRLSLNGVMQARRLILLQ